MSEDVYIAPDEKSVYQILDKVAPIFQDYINNRKPEEDIAQIQINIISSLHNLLAIGYCGLFKFLKNQDKQDFLKEVDSHYCEMRLKLIKGISEYLADKSGVEIFDEPIPITRKKQ